MIEKRWQGSQDEDDKAGIAEFVVDGGLRVSVPLESFDAFAAIASALDAAFTHGKAQGLRRLRGEIQSMLNKLDEDT